MKRLGKPVSIIIALLVLIFSVLSVFGYSYYTGDIKHTVFKGFGSLDWGIDAGGGTKVVIKPASADEAGTVADIVEERSAKYGLSEYQLYVNSNSEVVLVVPKSINSDYDSREVASYLTCFGNLTLRPGDDYTNMFVDSSGGASYITPEGDTAKTVLLDSSCVNDSATFDYNDGSATYHYVEVKFNSEGSNMLTMLTNEDTGAYYNQTVSVWLDDTMLASPSVSEPLDQGSFSFTNEHMTPDKAQLIAAVIGSEKMPCALTVSNFTEIPASLGKGVTELVFFAGAIALLLIAFVLIYKFRVVGVVSVLALIMQFSIILAILTGFAGDGHTFMMTVPSAAALALSVILTVISCVLVANRIKSEVVGGAVVDTAVSTGFKSAKNKIFDISFIVAIISIVGWFVFGASDLAVALFGNSVAGGISGFCYVMFLGGIFNFVTGYLLPQLMLRSIESFKIFDKASMFGGNK